MSTAVPPPPPGYRPAYPQAFSSAPQPTQAALPPVVPAAPESPPDPAPQLTEPLDRNRTEPLERPSPPRAVAVPAQPHPSPTAVAPPLRTAATPAPRRPLPSVAIAKPVPPARTKQSRRGPFWRRHRTADDHPSLTGLGNDADPVLDLDIPRIGGKPSIGKSRQAMTRLGIPLGVLIVVGGMAFGCGVDVGSDRIPAAGAVSQDEALRFRLSSFPADMAAAFAQRYLQSCLTHPAATDPAAARARLALITQMSTGGTDPGCGHADSATSAASAPREIVFTGQVRTVKTGYDVGAAAFLTFQVVFSDDKVVNAVLPVWVDDRADPATMRIVGSIGFMPVSSLGAPPPYNETRTKDAGLASKLNSSVLAPFLTAWGSSDAQQLGLVLTTDATAEAKTGLRGLLIDPVVNQVTVFTERAYDGSELHYVDGDLIIAQTGAQWTNTVTSTKQSAIYQIWLRLVQGKWAVVDIAGSAIDPTGGPVQGTTAPTPSKSATPTTTPTSTTTKPAAPALPPN